MKLALIVDDETDIRTWLFSLLESEGYRVATAPDGYEALKFVARQKPDVVVSDVRMPGIEGLELLSKIKHASPETRVVLISAYATDDMFLETIERGGDVLLQKPFRSEELLEALR